MAYLHLTTIVQCDVPRNSKYFATSAVMWDIEPRIVLHRSVKLPKSFQKASGKRETGSALKVSAEPSPILSDLATSVSNEYSIVDGNANAIRMAYDDEVYRTATIDLLSNWRG